MKTYKIIIGGSGDVEDTDIQTSSFQEEGQQKETQETKKSKSSNTAKTIGVAFVRKGIQETVSNYGKITGDNSTANKLEFMTTIAAYAGAAQLGAAGVAYIAMDVGTNAIHEQVEKSIELEKLARLRERTGYSNTYGSR